MSEFIFLLFSLKNIIILKQIVENLIKVLSGKISSQIQKTHSCHTGLDPVPFSYSKKIMEKDAGSCFLLRLLAVAMTARHDNEKTLQHWEVLYQDFTEIAVGKITISSILRNFFITRHYSPYQRRTKSLVLHFIQSCNSASFWCCYFIYFLLRMRTFL